MADMDDALQTFIVESRDLLEQMEDALLRIEQAPNDADTLNAIFRAAHTIKGSAGLFGIDHIVSFTHVAESVLDKLRCAELKVGSELVALLLAVRDHLGTLIDRVAEGSEPDADTARTGAGLEARLRAYLPGTQEAAGPAGPPVERIATLEPSSDNENGAETGNWHISLRFDRDVLKNGMDPLSFLRYLTTFGEIKRIVTVVDSVPPLSELAAENCYLGFELSYRSDADKATISDAFEFVRDDATISILPPHSKIADYVHLIEHLPEEELRLGDILVRCGTLTQEELDGALHSQSDGESPDPRRLGEMLVDRKSVQSDVVVAALEKQRQVREHRLAEGSMIRVNAEKLDEHINLVGELIIASAGVDLMAKGGSLPELNEAVERFTRLVEEVRDSALTLRMVQIAATFNKFQRVVRDVSAELGKDIHLEIFGAETELDKTVVEKIGDPLTHLVRNAMDHGIEPAEVRVAHGKPAQGTVTLNAYHESGSIVIEVSDDGAGLDRERILRKAVERGLVKPDQSLDDDAVADLIFEPGFSTVDQVSNLSGRGVGMDVVRRNIEALRGTVEIQSRPGLGATFRIRLPLTLAIIDGFLMGVGESHYVVPLDMVLECVELDRARQADNAKDYLNLRGEVLPLLRVRDRFGLDGKAARRQNVVVVDSAGHKAGLVVDELKGELQAVIKPLGRIFEKLRGISGSTILGSGEVALVLDVPSLLDQATVAELHAY